MAVSRRGIEKWRTETHRGKSVLRIVALFGVVVALGLVAMLVGQQRSASAATLIPNLHNSWSAYSDSGGDWRGMNGNGLLVANGETPFFANWAAEDDDTALSDCEAGFEAVWQANLTVGYGADSNTILLGYMRDLSPSQGTLDIDAFYIW